MGLRRHMQMLGEKSTRAGGNASGAGNYSDALRLVQTGRHPSSAAAQRSHGHNVTIFHSTIETATHNCGIEQADYVHSKI